MTETTMSFFGITMKLICDLMREVFKSLDDLNPEFLWSYFVFKNITYSIKNGPLLRLPDTKSTSYGINLV